MDKDLQKTIKSAVGALTILMLLATIALIVKIATDFNWVSRDDYNTITVDGDSEIYATPDIATISFGAQAENKDLTQAQADVEKVVSGAIDEIVSAGISKDDIKTTYYNSYPRYDYNRKCDTYGCENGDRVLLGYEVSQTVSVKVRDLDKVSAILGILGKAKVSDISGPNFDIEDRDALVQQAREEAIKEAKEKAKGLAKDLGVHLGKIVSFYEGGYGVPMYAAGGDMAMSVTKDSREEATVSPTIPEGQNRIYSSVSIVYKIK